MTKSPALNAAVEDEDLDAVLAYLPKLEALAPNKYVREHPVLKPSKNKTALTLAYPDYDPVVEKFEQALYDHGFIRSFDWGKWQPTAVKMCDDPDRVNKATMTTCIKLLTLHVRKERFCEGHLEAMLRSGHIVAILRRMQMLKETL